MTLSKSGRTAALPRAKRPRTILPRPQQAPRRSHAWRTRRRADAIAGWVMLTPSVVLIGVFGLIPVVWSVVLSFQHNDLQTPGRLYREHEHKRRRMQRH